MSIIGISNTVLFIVAILANIGWRKALKSNDKLREELREVKFEKDLANHEVKELTEKLETALTPKECNKGEWCSACQHGYVIKAPTISDSGHIYTVKEYACDIMAPCKGYER